jgi:hypothetical protein
LYLARTGSLLQEVALTVTALLVLIACRTGDTVVGIFDDGTLLEWDSGQVEIASANLGYQARRACVNPSSDWLVALQLS